MWEQFEELSTAAARQHGMVTLTQAARIGVDDATLGRYREVGLLWELDWAVYQLAGNPVGPRYAYPYCAWLAFSPELFAWERPSVASQDAVLSHRSACGLHGLGSAPGSGMVFTVPRPCAAPRATIVHVSDLAPEDIMISGGVPVTTPHRTILDLVSEAADHSEIRRVLSDAIRKDLADLREVYTDLTPLAREYEFPAGRSEFVAYFMPDIRPESLSPRNLRSYASLTAHHRVVDMQQRVTRFLAEVNSFDDRDRPDDVEELSWRIAEEIVGATIRN